MAALPPSRWTFVQRLRAPAGSRLQSLHHTLQETVLEGFAERLIVGLSLIRILQRELQQGPLCLSGASQRTCQRSRLRGASMPFGQQFGAHVAVFRQASTAQVFRLD